MKKVERLQNPGRLGPVMANSVCLEGLFIFGMDVLKVGEALQTQEGTRWVDLWR